LKFISNVVLLSFSLLLVTACAAAPRQDPAYVPPDLYDNYNCRQLHAQRVFLDKKIDDLTGEDDAKQVINAAVSFYAASQGYNVGVNPRANDVELRLYRNKRDVLEEAAIRKECKI
jgi:hypothetical protein